MNLSTSVPSPDVGRRIRELRLRRKLSQRGLAEPRYDGSYVSQIEAGRRMPSDDALAFFAAKLGTSIDELTHRVPPSARVELELALADGRGAFETGDVARAAEGYAELLRLARELRTPEYEAEALRGIGEIAERAGRITEAIDRYHEAEALAESSELRTRIRVALGRAYRSGGDLAYSIDVLDAAMNDAIEHGWPAEAVRAASLLSASFSERGDHQRARQVLDGVAEQAALLDEPRALAAWHWMRGRTIAALGRPEDALKHLGAARAIYEHQRAAVELARLDGARAESLMEMNRPAEAVALMETAVPKLRDAGALSDAARMQTELARAHLSIGHRREAIRIAEDALSRQEDLEDPIERATCSVVLALALGSDPRAESLLRDAVAAFETHGVAGQGARALQALGEFYVMTGRHDDALEAFRRALSVIVTP